MHSERMTAPRGWEIVRIAPDPEALRPSSDDLEALANAVREAARPRYSEHPPAENSSGEGDEGIRRGHLRVIHSHDPILTSANLIAQLARESDSHAIIDVTRVTDTLLR